MDKVAVTPKSQRQMEREYPLVGFVEGWYFRQREVSNGCWLVEGSDAYGRTVSRQTVGDPELVLRECVEFARKIVDEQKAKTRS